MMTFPATPPIGGAFPKPEPMRPAAIAEPPAARAGVVTDPMRPRPADVAEKAAILEAGWSLSNSLGCHLPRRSPKIRPSKWLSPMNPVTLQPPS